MAEFSRQTAHRRLVSSTTSVFNWSKAREAEFITQKIDSRMMELEKDGTKVISNLRKLSSWVEEMIEDARLNIKILKTKEDLKESYQEVSQILGEVEDNIAMLAASIVRWQISEVDSENNVNNNIDKNVGIEPVPRRQLAEEEVLKESVKNRSGQVDKKNSEGLNNIDDKNSEGLTNIATQYKICDVKLTRETATESIKKNQHNNCDSITHIIGDQNILAHKENSVSSVVIVYNLDPDFVDCDRLFNLISQYAIVKCIQIKKMSALVELTSWEEANRVKHFLDDSELFNRRIEIKHSSILTVKRPNSTSYLPNGGKAFKEFSEDKRIQFPHLRSDFMNPPSRTVYFYRTPKMTDEEFYEIFERLKAPLPYIVMWFPNKCQMSYSQWVGRGCLQFKSKEDALKAICIANHAVIERLNTRILLAFTYERRDHHLNVQDENSERDNNASLNVKNRKILKEELKDELVSKTGSIPTAHVSAASPKLVYQNPELMELASSSLSKLLPPDLEKIAMEAPSWASIVKMK